MIQRLRCLAPLQYIVFQFLLSKEKGLSPFHIPFCLAIQYIFSLQSPKKVQFLCIFLWSSVPVIATCWSLSFFLCRFISFCFIVLKEDKMIWVRYQLYLYILSLKCYSDGSSLDIHNLVSFLLHFWLTYGSLPPFISKRLSISWILDRAGPITLQCNSYFCVFFPLSLLVCTPFLLWEKN